MAKQSSFFGALYVLILCVFMYTQFQTWARHGPEDRGKWALPNFESDFVEPRPDSVRAEIHCILVDVKCIYFPLDARWHEFYFGFMVMDLGSRNLHFPTMSLRPLVFNLWVLEIVVHDPFDKVWFDTACGYRTQYDPMDVCSKSLIHWIIIPWLFFHPFSTCTKSWLWHSNFSCAVFYFLLC